MRICEIENLTYDEAKERALEMLKIKEHDCFLVDLGEYFEYSMLVFKNQRHIYFANDYEMHHSVTMEEFGREGLRELYIKQANNKLFTDKELMEEVRSYDEYKKKDYFLRNYWIMRYDYTSIFAISEKDKAKVKEGIKKHPYFNPICFCYVVDEKIVKDAEKYHQHLEMEYEKLKANLDEFRRMIRYELANHEACVSCSADDTLYALCLKYEELSSEQQKIVKEELNRQIRNYYGEYCDD